ncbi:MAG: hypothetical protein D3916_18590, partial [Candidatus Electrothrix sp. MAN1_4]|nr:hypothetical protein [Candidatus Electrothrix sp. MAN1_4]
MFLFDTDVITNVLKKTPSHALLQKLDGLSRAQQYISTITISEIVYGALPALLKHTGTPAPERNITTSPAHHKGRRENHTTA